MTSVPTLPPQRQKERCIARQSFSALNLWSCAHAQSQRECQSSTHMKRTVRPAAHFCSPKSIWAFSPAEGVSTWSYVRLATSGPGISPPPSSLWMKSRGVCSLPGSATISPVSTKRSRSASQTEPMLHPRLSATASMIAEHGGSTSNAACFLTLAWSSAGTASMLWYLRAAFVSGTFLCRRFSPS